MFVTFEGPEGGGKSSAIEAIATALRSRGLDVTTTREPGAGPFGKQVRDLLLHGEDLSGTTELFLFLADRSHNIERVVRPALLNGGVVLCDRHADSTLVYQGFARGLDSEFLRRANRFATGELNPDLTLLFDLSPRVGLQRVKHKDRLDSEPIEFHEAVREGFLKLAVENPERWLVLDASQEQEAVIAVALEAVRSRLELKKLSSYTD